MPSLPDSHFRNKLFSSSMLMLAARLIVKSIGLVSSIILARVLVPEDFGLVAIAMALYAFVDLFGAFGLGTVLIQKQTKCVNDYNTAWTFKVLFGAVSSVLMIVLAPFLASYYEDQRLEVIIYVIAFMSLISGAQNIGVIDFQKDMDFRKELKFLVAPKILSFIITISLAYWLQNYWALVLGMLGSNLISLLFSYIMHPYRPRFSLVSLTNLLGFSKWLLFNNLLFFVNTRVTELIIGKLLSPSATGLYSIANEFASIPTTEIAAPLNKASFPLYSKFSNDLVELKLSYLKTLAMSATLTGPAALGIALITPLFVSLMFGEAWLDAIPVMQWIAISSILFSLTTNNSYIYMACGRPNISFYINLSRVVVFLPLLIWLVDINGLVGAGQSMFITSIFMLVITQVAIGIFLNINISELLIALIRPAISSVFMYFTVVYVQQNLFLAESLISLVGIILSGGVSYISMIIILWFFVGKPDGFEKDIVLMVNSKFRSKA